MEATVDVRSALPPEVVLWYCYRSIFSGVISISQSLGIIIVRAHLTVCDAVLGLCVDSAVSQVRVDLLGVIRIVFIEAIRDLLLIRSFSMKVWIHVVIMKDISNLVVRSRIGG